MLGRSRFLLIVLIAVGLCLGFSALRSQNPKITMNDYPITFQFIHKVGDEMLIMDTIRYVNLFGNKYSVAALKYFVSGFVIHASNGENLELKETFYIDASNSNTCRLSATRKIPPGTYSGISFIFGLDNVVNVSGRFLNPPENRMEWPDPMGGGYHYMKLEGKIDSGGEIANFQAHSGKLYDTPHFLRVSLRNSSFTVDQKGIIIQIVMDINNWWKNPHTFDLNDITAIMDNGPVQQQLMENGADVFTIGSIN